MVHILREGARLKTVPSRFTAAQLRQLVAEGARPEKAPMKHYGPRMRVLDPTYATGLSRDTTMETTRLGTTGPKISRLALGCMS